jgi:hypothetical protein
MPRLMFIPVAWWALYLMLVATGCRMLDPDLFVAQSAERIILDSSQVRRLISAQARIDLLSEQSLRDLPPRDRARQIGDMIAQSAKHVGARDEFIAAVVSEPGIVIERGTYYRELRNSKAKCAADAISNLTYVKIRIISGARKGLEGWRCGSAEPVNELP